MNENLETLVEQKLLLLYLIDKSGGKYHYDDLTNKILEEDLMNFFHYNQYFVELLESKLVKKNREGFLFLTEEGEEMLQIFSDKIEEILSNRSLKDQEENVETSYFGHISENNLVELFSYQGHELIFHLKVQGKNEDDARHILESFETTGESFLKEIVSELRS